GWSHAHFRPPPTTNLCRLFWRSVISLIFVWPFMSLLALVGFWFAKRPPLYYDECHHPLTAPALVPYRRWPRIAGMRVYPIVIVSGISLFQIPWNWAVVGWASLFLAVLGLLAVLVEALIQYLDHHSVPWAWKSSTAQLWVAYV